MIRLGVSVLSLAVHLQATAFAGDKTHDIVIYGGTSSAVAAAVQARRMGKSVIIVCPERHLGGLTAGGLGWTDSGDKSVVGGVGREFYQRVKRHYDRPEAWKWQRPEEYSRYRPQDDAIWVFEPHVAERTFEEWIREERVPVDRDRWLDRAGNGVKKDGPRIVSITMRSGETYRGRIFIDATYEGDLMAAAGVTYHVGRESNAKYGETLNGVQKANARSHQFTSKIDPYVRPGDPKSGLLPRVDDGDPGEDGQGDRRVQAYTYRVCLTRVPENRVPFPRPEGYDPFQYELLLRDLKAGSRHVFGKFDPAPNAKTDTNNHGSFSTDNIGMNYDYPEASYERRREILAEHELYQKGYFYFLSTDPRVPADVRDRMSRWGLARDEFLDNGHWPHQIYVREARRMVSDFVMTELHLRRLQPTPKPVGMGSYNMDSHHTQRYVARDPDGRAYVRNEGDIQVDPGGPYPISYEAIIPRKDQCANLLVPVCLSSSHIAYGSIRMEPVFMILGQAAATAAAIAIDDGAPVQEVDYERLRRRLLADKAVLEDHGPLRPRGSGLDPGKLTGIVIDDVDARRTSSWLESTSVPGYVGRSYLHDDDAGKGGRSVRFEARVPERGCYEIRIAYTPHPNRATNVPVIVEAGGKTIAATVNQKRSPAIDDLWQAVGAVSLDANEQVVVTISNEATDGYVIVDAVQIIPRDG